MNLNHIKSHHRNNIEKIQKRGEDGKRKKEGRGKKEEREREGERDEIYTDIFGGAFS